MKRTTRLVAVGAAAVVALGGMAATTSQANNGPRTSTGHSAGQAATVAGVPLPTAACKVVDAAGIAAVEVSYPNLKPLIDALHHAGATDAQIAAGFMALVPWTQPSWSQQNAYNMYTTFAGALGGGAPWSTVKPYKDDLFAYFNAAKSASVHPCGLSADEIAKLAEANRIAAEKERARLAEAARQQTIRDAEAARLQAIRDAETARKAAAAQKIADAAKAVHARALYEREVAILEGKYQGELKKQIDADIKATAASNTAAATSVAKTSAAHVSAKKAHNRYREPLRLRVKGSKRSNVVVLHNKNGRSAVVKHNHLHKHFKRYQLYPGRYTVVASKGAKHDHKNFRITKTKGARVTLHL